MPSKPARPTGEGPRNRFMVPAFVLATAAIVTTEFIAVGLLPLLAKDLGIALERAGWLVSVFAVSAAVFGPAVTLLAGRWSPRTFLTLSPIVFGLCNLLAALMPDFAALLAARAVQGALLTPFVSIASAMAAAHAGEHRAGQAIGQVNMGTVIGIVLIVPAAVALAELFGWRAVFAGLGVFTLLAAGTVAATAPHWRDVHEVPVAQQADILQRREFLGHLALSTLLFTAMFAAYSYIAAFLEDVIGLSGAHVALALFGFGLAGIGGNWLASRFVDREPTALTMVVALLIALATAGLSFAAAYWLAAALLMGVWGAAHMAAFVACQVRVMFAGRDAPAFAGSLNIAVCNLGIAAGAILGGWVVSWFGVAMIGLASAALGIAALVTGWRLWRLPHRSGRRQAVVSESRCCASP